MATTVDTFPVGSLLNGDSYKTSTRMQNISTAMSWIQKQLESLKESDKQLVNLFQKLETDMAEIKQYYYTDGGRGRNSSISSIRDIYSKTSNNSVTPFDTSRHSPLLSTRVTIVEDEVTAILEHSDSEDSLADFADELGGFGDEEEEEEGTPLSTGRPSIRSQSSGISSNNDSSLTVPTTTSTSTHTSTHSLLHEEEEEKREESSLDHSVRGYTLATEKGRRVRRLSNDSGAVADSDSTGSSVGGELKELPKLSGGKSALPALTDDDQKRLSGFADEIFAMFKLGNS